jgi:hypothetical protein
LPFTPKRTNNSLSASVFMVTCTLWLLDVGGAFLEELPVGLVAPVLESPGCGVEIESGGMIIGVVCFAVVPVVEPMACEIQADRRDLVREAAGFRDFRLQR